MADYKHFEVSENQDGRFSRNIKTSPISELPQNDLLVKVSYSSLNYKDALSVSGNRGVTKNYPHTPGIDAAGIVENSNSERFKSGDEVIVTSYDLGMNTPGGFSEYISVPSAWAIKKPSNITLRESMIIGTAGLTAAMALDKIQTNGVFNGKIAVTGATGGVGLWALLLSKHLNYETVAISRKIEFADNFDKISVNEKIFDFEINQKPLAKPAFEAAVDTVGGDVLGQLLKLTKPNGSVAVCGMAASPKLNTTVFPFILRGINLLGIDSAEATLQWREHLWNKLGNEWKLDFPEWLVHEIGLNQLENSIEKMLKGEHFGRTIISLIK